MNVDLLNNLEKSDFGNNKYYIEIIKNFIEKYPKETSRLNVSGRNIHLKASDDAGSRDIYFELTSYNNLKIRVERNVDLYKYQDIIMYDEKGIMVERSNCFAKLKTNVNEILKDNKEALKELSEIGKTASLYTGKLFDLIEYKSIKRPDNYGLEGSYIGKNMTYNEKGLRKGNLVEGTFNVLDSSSVSTLEFPDTENIKITNMQNLDDENTYSYPNSRSL